jgi:uncharacterized protein (DUF305 family)
MNLESNAKVILVGLVAFVVGASVMHFSGNGYMDHGWGAEGADRGQNRGMQHTMMDGTMMDNTNMMSKGTSSMKDMMMNMNAGLQGKSGKDLEKAFLTEMIPHHEGAVTMAQAVLADKTITNQDVIRLANDIVTSQQKEISEMKLWLTTY